MNGKTQRCGFARWLRAAMILLVAAAAPACAQTAASGVDASRLMADVRALAHDSMAGRRAGTAGGAAARRYIANAFATIGLASFNGSHVQAFDAGRRDGAAAEVANVVGRIDGSAGSGRVIVVTAHYDHLGERDGQVFNGADDNASGVAAMLELARLFSSDAPRHTIVFAALDAEESGLRGARAFVADPPVELERIAIDINLDMVGRNVANELWVAGTAHTPSLQPLIARIAADAAVTLRVGHDRPGVAGQDDWTGASDHGAFHERGIPFLYFGVEDHADYHKESDEAAGIEPTFLANAVATIHRAVQVLDRELDQLVPARGR